jgi:hypothetical protein
MLLVGDPNVKPKNVPIPVEANAALRGSDSIVFIFKPIGQVLTKLVIQVSFLTHLVPTPFALS